MFTRTRLQSILFVLCIVMSAFSTIAQPTLPDITGSNENGIVLLSWMCQYDGVKSIAVLRSADSTFNYSTIGYVKKVYKGVQAFADGHPYPGKNFYKVSLVFNSGLTWTCNHFGVYVDSSTIRRVSLSNEALQKLIVTETEKPRTEEPVRKKTVAPADRDKYMEVFRKPDSAATTAVQPKFRVSHSDEPDTAEFLSTMPEGAKKRMTITYDDAPDEVNPNAYLEDTKKPVEQKKKISITFDDKEDVSAFIETLPKASNRKITISYNNDNSDVNPTTYIDDAKKPETPKKQPEADKPKKISMTFNDEDAARVYMESLPKKTTQKITVSYNVDSSEFNSHKYAEVIKKPTEPAKPRISIKFTDDMNINESAEVKSKYISMDAVSGHVKINLPDDVATHHYSIKFYDKEKHVVIEVPHINASKIILDKRNFQKKGQYKFTIRKDVLELESGYINIY